MAVAIARIPEVVPVQTSIRATERAPQLPALTGLRFLAALLIVCHHITRHFRPGLIPVPHTVLGPVTLGINAVLYEGNAAVSFFFVLSGFILAYTYIQKDGHLRGTLRRYYVARIGRVYPVYLLAFVVAALPFAMQAGADQPRLRLITLLSGLTLTQTWPQLWGQNVAYSWNDPGWSLSVEAFFYLVFPLLALAIGRLRFWTLVAFIACVALCGMYLPGLVIGPSCARHLTAVACADIVDTLPPLRLPEFVLGLALGALVVRWPDVVRFSLPLGLVLAACVLSLCLLAARVTFSSAALPLCWIALVCAGARGRGRLGAALGSRPVVRLGEASYALYLLHWPLWFWITRALGVPQALPASRDPAAVPLSLAYVVLCVAFSLFAYRFVETPARHAIRRRWG